VSKDSPTSSTGDLVLYRTADGKTRMEIRLDADTLWLTQAQIAELFQTTPQNVTTHLRGIFAEGELDPDATCKDYLQVRTEGGRSVQRSLRHYALPVILAVGMRVRSPRGTEFRQWAITRLDEYLRKGFVMDDERLKNPPVVGVPDYFDELLERIRDIRASERRMYLRVRDILALAADYQPKNEETTRVFQIVQNKLHFAATGLTAPELIARRANPDAPNMGLTVWKGDRVKPTDVTVAKNYLLEPEITELNRIVTMFLDFAEDQASRRKQVFLRDWETKLDEFLRFNERRVLADGGSVSRGEADRRALAAFDAFAERRRALTESAAEVESVQALEQAAKAISKRASSHRKGEKA
jgi:hypothetical protein